MKSSTIKLTSVILAASMFSSCTNIKDDQTRTRVEPALALGILGAVAGGIIGHQSGNAWQGAAIGGLAGGATGFAVGDHVARKKAAYKSTEQWLDACIANAEKVNRDAVAYNRRLTNRIAGLQGQVRAARAAGNTRELSRLKTQVAAMQNEARAQRSTVDSEIKSQNTALRSAGNASGTVNLRSRVSDLNATSTSLRSSEKRLADLGNQIDV